LSVRRLSRICSSRCSAPGLPRLLRQVELGPLGVGVEDHRADVDRRDPVHQRVVGLRDRGEAPAVEVLDQVDLP
jgi:hypothetical protein